MSKFVFKLNKYGVRELMKSSEAYEMIKAVTDSVTDLAGGNEAGYYGNTKRGENRVVGHVFATTTEAKIDNEENNTLLRAIGG